MKNIKIEIPANLSPEKEAIEIAKKLVNSNLMLGNNNVKIGDGHLEVQSLNTIIEVKRIPKEPLMCQCSICETHFEKPTGKKLFTNYGGKVKETIYCSEGCRKTIINVLTENRYSFKRSSLQTFRLF